MGLPRLEWSRLLRSFPRCLSDPGSPAGAILGASGVGTDPLRVSLPRALRPLPAALILTGASSDVSDLTPRAPGSGAWRPLSPGAAVLSLPPGTRDYRTSPPAFMCRASRHGLGGKARAPGKGRPLSTDPQFLTRLRSPAADGGTAAAIPPGRLCAAGGHPCPLPPPGRGVRCGRFTADRYGRGPALPGGPHPGAAAPGAYFLGISRGRSPGNREAPGRSQLPGALCQAEAGEIPARQDTIIDKWRMVGELRPHAIKIPRRPRICQAENTPGGIIVFSGQFLTF